MNHKHGPVWDYGFDVVEVGLGGETVGRECGERVGDRERKGYRVGNEEERREWEIGRGRERVGDRVEEEETF